MATKAKRRKPPKVSRTHKPDHLSLEEWQLQLRRQFGREQKFKLKNLNGEGVFSEFAVHNPQSKTTYRVTVRGALPGDNACTCGDFMTNALGTCKHIEFALGALERKFGQRALNGKYEPAASEVCLHYGARQAVRFRPGRDCPPELARLAAKWFDEDDFTLPDSAITRFHQFVEKAVAIEPELHIGDDVLTFVAERRDGEERRSAIDKLFPKGIRSAAFKNLLKTQLYDYQREGALFAARAGRCLIGDDMGLGKTIQAIAAAEILARHFGVGRALIVCPTSLKHQWQREIERFAGRTAQVVGGLRPTRAAAFAGESFFKITNYDTIHTDLDLIQQWSPDLVILDEAQRIKNWSTRAARSVKQISAPHAIVLTGTPLENRLEELVSIVQFVDRHRLGPTYQLLDRHQERDEVGRVTGYRDLDKLGASLAPILVRRTKKEVLTQLPKRLDQTHFVPMTAAQRQLHEENRELVAKIVFKWRRYKFLSEADRQRLMIFLQNMRMSCDSSYLLDQASDHGHKADEIATLLSEMAEEPGVKAVVFSQWLRMHELIVRRLAERKLGHVLFHGGVPGPKRKDLIETFRAEPGCRVFLSTDAGGVGLNLQFASVVVNADIPWNPAVLEQRIGRVHRLGQERPVRVINFVAQGTIENGMLGVLDFKRGLASGILDGGPANISLGGSRLTKFMETVEKTTAAIPTAEVESEPEPPRQREPANTAAGDPWAQLLQVGRAMLDQIVGKGSGPAIERDAATGQNFLKLPVPPPEVLGPLVQALAALLPATR